MLSVYRKNKTIEDEMKVKAAEQAEQAAQEVAKQSEEAKDDKK